MTLYNESIYGNILLVLHNLNVTGSKNTPKLLARSLTLSLRILDLEVTSTGFVRFNFFLHFDYDRPYLSPSYTSITEKGSKVHGKQVTQPLLPSLRRLKIISNMSLLFHWSDSL
jgi:hypothetical protein